MTIPKSTSNSSRSGTPSCSPSRTWPSFTPATASEADSDEFVAPLRAASGVWISGGRQWRLVDSYFNTRTLRELRALLDRGGVIGGTSAGATIQGSYLVRGAREGNQIMMAKGYEEGFGFLKNVAIDQHILARHRENDLVAVIEAHPELLGLGIDEATAIVVQGDRFEVIGKSVVGIYDGKDHDGKSLLSAIAGRPVRPQATPRQGDENHEPDDRTG